MLAPAAPPNAAVWEASAAAIEAPDLVLRLLDRAVGKVGNVGGLIVGNGHVAVWPDVHLHADTWRGFAPPHLLKVHVRTNRLDLNRVVKPPVSRLIVVIVPRGETNVPVLWTGAVITHPDLGLHIAGVRTKLPVVGRVNFDVSAVDPSIVGSTVSLVIGAPAAQRVAGDVVVRLIRVEDVVAVIAVRAPHVGLTIARVHVLAQPDAHLNMVVVSAGVVEAETAICLRHADGAAPEHQGGNKGCHRSLGDLHRGRMDNTFVGEVGCLCMYVASSATGLGRQLQAVSDDPSPDPLPPLHLEPGRPRSRIHDMAPKPAGNAADSLPSLTPPPRFPDCKIYSRFP